MLENIFFLPPKQNFFLASRIFSKNRGVKISEKNKFHKEKFQIKTFICETDRQTDRPTLFRLEYVMKKQPSRQPFRLARGKHSSFSAIF